MKSLCCFVIASTALLGQSAPEPIRIGSVTVSGTLRTRAESWDWFEGAANNDYTYLGSLLRLSLSHSSTKADWLVEFAAPVLLGLPDDAIAAGTQGQLGLGASYFASNNRNTNAAMLFVKQGYLRLKGLPDGQSLKFGRMEFVDGTEVAPKNATLAALKKDRIAHRLLGNFGFSHVGRSFDGVQYGITGGKLNFTALAARPTRGVFQVDGWGELNTNVFYGALTGQAAGRVSAGEWRLFGLGYSDYRDGVLKTDSRALATRRGDTEHIQIGTYGGHYLHTVSTKAGAFDAMVWGAAQRGSWGTLKHRAISYAAEAGFQPNVLRTVKPWIRGGVNYGSGDGNANDGTHGTFFQVLPTPRIYARMPFFNLMNSRDVFAEGILRPSKSLSVRADVHSLALAKGTDLWYMGGGAYQPWTFGYTGRASGGNTGLANLYDVSADYSVNAHFAFGLYFGHASGKDVMRSIYPNDPSGNFGFIELSYKF